MRVEPVDERDSGWEDAAPRFRVYLFDPATAPSYAVETYDVTEADVLETVRWAEARAGTDRRYAVALVRDTAPWGAAERGLVWLAGRDLNSAGG